MRMKKRLALLLAAVMLVGLLPTAALAVGDGDGGDALTLTLDNGVYDESYRQTYGEVEYSTDDGSNWSHLGDNDGVQNGNGYQYAIPNSASGYQLKVTYAANSSYTAELEKAFAKYNELKSQTESLDPVELFHARENLRNECEEAAENRIRTASKSINFWDMTSARSAVDGKVDLYSEEQKVKRILLEKKQNEREQPKQKKPKDRGYER